MINVIDFFGSSYQVKWNVKMTHFDLIIVGQRSLESTDKTPATDLKEVAMTANVTFNLNTLTSLPHSRQCDRRETHVKSTLGIYLTR